MYSIHVHVSIHQPLSEVHVPTSTSGSTCTCVQLPGIVSVMSLLPQVGLVSLTIQECCLHLYLCLSYNSILGTFEFTFLAYCLYFPGCSAQLEVSFNFIIEPPLYQVYTSLPAYFKHTSNCLPHSKLLQLLNITGSEVAPHTLWPYSTHTAHYCCSPTQCGWCCQAN